MKVAVTGSSGLIGTALVASLRADGHEVIRLVRRPARSADEVRWDPRAADAGCQPVQSRRAGRARRLRAPGRRGGRGPPLDGQVQGGDPGQPGARHPRAGRRAGQARLAARDPGVRLGHRLVRRHRRTRGGRVRARREGLPRPGGPGLGGGRRARPPTPASGSCTCAAAWSSPPAAACWPAAPAGPARACARGSARAPGDELDLADRRDRRDPVPARPQGHQRPGQPDRPRPVTNSEFTAALAAAVGRRDLPWLRVPAPALRLGLGEAAVELLTSARVSPRACASRLPVPLPHPRRGPVRRTRPALTPPATRSLPLRPAEVFPGLRSPVARSSPLLGLPRCLQVFLVARPCLRHRTHRELSSLPLAVAT